MYNNSIIQWHAGMELNTAVFRNLEKDLTERQRLTIRTALADGRIGVLPDTELHVEGGFVKRTLETTDLRITALTASGKILAVNDDLKTEIPQLEATDYYLCVGESKTQTHEFERDGILYEGPQYELSIIESSDIDTITSEDLIPLKHLQVVDGSLDIDDGYIVPTLSLKNEQSFEKFRDRYASELEAIATHENMDEGDCKRTMLNLLFRMKTFSMERQVRDFVELLQEVALTVRYYVVDGLGKTLETCPELPLKMADDERSQPSQYNIVEYLRWMDEYLESMQEIMKQVVIIDNSIDYEKLKSELREEIYAKLRDELYEKLRKELHDSLETELTDSIMEAVSSLINDHLHPELHEQLNIDLHDPLYNDLYDALYKALFDALYKPIEKAKDNFVPLI